MKPSSVGSLGAAMAGSAGAEGRGTHEDNNAGQTWRFTEQLLLHKAMIP